MPYESFDLRFEGCNHTMKIPLLHNQDDRRSAIQSCAISRCRANARLA
jgi:hypothetical protein